MSYFNEINGYLSSLKESQSNEASMASEMANKKAQTIQEKFQSVNSSIESAGGIMVAGAEGWFKGRKILEKLGKAVKGKSKGGATGTDISTPQTTNGAGTMSKDATLGDVKTSVGDGDLAPSGLSRTITPALDGKITVPRAGKAPAKPAVQEPEADNPLGGGAPLKDVQQTSQDLRSSIPKSSKAPAQADPAAQDSGQNISSMAEDAANRAKSLGGGAAEEDIIGNVKSTTTKFGFNLDRPQASTTGGGGSGAGGAGDAPSSSVNPIKDVSNDVSSNVDGIADSVESGVKTAAKNVGRTVADTLGVDGDAVMGAANVALDGIPIVGEIFGIGTMIAGLVKDIAGKGGEERKAMDASESSPESARGAVDTGNVASTGGTTQGSYIA